MIMMSASSTTRGQKHQQIPQAINATDAARLVFSTGKAVTRNHFMQRDEAHIQRFVKPSVQLALHGTATPER